MNDNTELDKKMVEAGMTPLTEMLKKRPLDQFMTHAGVTDLVSFEDWLTMRYKEMLSLQATIELKGNPEENELYEWAIAHTAVLREVIVNYRATKE